MGKVTLANILSFIQRRFPTKDLWENGNCYYFSRLLADRFPYLEIYYDQIDGHFVAGTGKDFFDINGRVPVHKDALVKLKWIKTNDPVWYERLWRDCIR